MKIFILYKKEDYNIVKDFAESLSGENNFEVEYQPVAVGKFYHNLLDSILQSDMVIFFWSFNSIKSKWFQIIVDKVIINNITFFSVVDDLSESDLSIMDTYFLLLSKFPDLTKFPKSTQTKLEQIIKISKTHNFEVSLPVIQSLMIGRIDIVNFAVFAPYNIEVGSGFTIDIWAYLEDQYNSVLKKAEEIKRDQIIGRQNSVTIKRKSHLTVTLKMETLHVLTNFNYLYWQGKPASTSFALFVPKEASIGEHFGTAKIYFRGICITNLIFTVNVSHSMEISKYQDMTEKIKKYKTAFASYSSEDSSEVYSKVHGMTKIAPDLDIFLSRLSLKSKEIWEEALLEQVPNKDVFYLFWSRNAIKSKWVDKEWRLALKKRDLSYIDPVPLESPKLATPPPELSALHFDDIWIALKGENDFIDTFTR